MADLILHHFDASPYAEKARLMLGIKGLNWHSVQIPWVMPKPDLTALTGGYRKTPVLQVGADIYCDTACIAMELERRYPAPTLCPPGQAGFAYALAAWGDRFFAPGAGLSMAVNAEQLPEALMTDRRAFFTHMDFDTFGKRIPHMYAQLRAEFELLERQLADGRRFLGGDAPGLVDVHAGFVLFMLRGFVPDAAQLADALPALAAWDARLRLIGHGRPHEMRSAEALEIAACSTPEPPRGVDRADPQQFAAGQRVTVTPGDYGKDPVSGELVTLQVHEVAIRRFDPRGGELVVHFPRIGYLVEAA
jgi:glutathione S-transferase